MAGQKLSPNLPHATDAVLPDGTVCGSAAPGVLLVVGILVLLANQYGRFYCRPARYAEGVTPRVRRKTLVKWL